MADDVKIFLEPCNFYCMFCATLARRVHATNDWPKCLYCGATATEYILASEVRRNTAFTIRTCVEAIGKVACGQTLDDVIKWLEDEIAVRERVIAANKHAKTESAARRRDCK